MRHGRGLLIGLVTFLGACFVPPLEELGQGKCDLALGHDCAEGLSCVNGVCVTEGASGGGAAGGSAGGAAGGSAGGFAGGSAGGTAGGSAGGTAGGSAGGAAGGTAGGAAGGAAGGSAGGASDAGLPNYAFVTSTAYPGSFFGPIGGDSLCRDRAADAGLPRASSFRAWVSISSPDGGAAAKLVGSRGWIRTDGRPFTDTIPKLLQQKQIFYALNLDEWGRPSTHGTWTGTNGDGTVNPNNCNGWSSANTQDTGLQGIPAFSSTFWSGLFSPSCDVPQSLYCFGTGASVPVGPQTPPGSRLAFLSRAAVASGPGLLTFDGLCQSDAQDAGLPGSYLALVSPVLGLTPASRFKTDAGTWIRVDGTPLTATAYELLYGGPPPPATINVTAIGTYEAIYDVWTGSVAPYSSSGGNCASWTGTSGMANFGNSDVQGTTWFNSSMLGACNQPRHLYCLQQ